LVRTAQRIVGVTLPDLDTVRRPHLQRHHTPCRQEKDTGLSEHGLQQGEVAFFKLQLRNFDREKQYMGFDLSIKRVTSDCQGRWHDDII